jgi:prepilin-type N-terminal cleavage/methylation domain-containing protein
VNKNGFSLIEIVFTIIIIGLTVGAITESFIAGSAKSVNIVNEETAVNVAKQEMAALNYCRNGGIPTSGVCNAFNNGVGSGSSPWITNLSSFANQQPPYLINNECFYTTVNAANVDFTDHYKGINGNGYIQNTSPDFIQTIVQTGWFASNAGGGSCPTPPAGCPGTTGSCPYITLSTVYANY